ncbi:MAG TPA: NYN domain-containing protein [Candidatus Hydrogenedentes bacterium]|nr:NYN domain-containing protein [Candidatus Hydrogenedentota bacterium]HNT89799.1 NYN domain-containing protein [Candidatus Hydrogenedentota bacterium]
MSEHYYIDGYNVLHMSALLRPLLDADFEAAREALIDKVALFCTATGKRATIVFDGRGKHHGEPVAHGRGVAGLEVVYTPGRLTADAYIERLAYQASERREVTVVSSDQGIRALCRGLGTLVMDADNFLNTVRSLRAEMDGALERRKAPEAIARVEDGLDPESLEKLQALRNMLKK